MQIVAIFLLFLYALIQIHNVLPHSHEERNEISSVESHNKDSHKYHRHDHHHSKKTHSHHIHDSSDNFLSLVLGLFHDVMHLDLGENHFEDYLVQKDKSLNFEAYNDLICKQYHSIANIIPLQECDSEVSVRPPPDIIESIFLSSLDKRGPPVML